MIIISGPISESTLPEIAGRLTENCTVGICSEGGELGPALALYDILRALKVDTVALGYCCSAASLLLQAGKTRYVAPNSRLMVHSLSYDMGGNPNQHRDYLEEMDWLQGRMLQIYSRGRKNRKLIKDMLDSGSDFYFSPGDAIAANLADRIW